MIVFAKSSLEQLDLLLLTVAKTRRVQQDGIHFQNHRYMDINLAAFVKEEVLIRYDPADMGEIHVFYQDRFLCRAICAELSDRKVSLKEIEQARAARRKQVRAGLSTREAMVNRYVEIHHAPSPAPKTVVANPRQSKRDHDSRGTLMTEQNEEKPPSFVETKNYRRFGEMCDACQRARVVGLSYGPPGTGKTESAKQYAQWDLFKPFLPETFITFTGRSAVDDLYPYRPLTFPCAPLDMSMRQCRTVFYTPPASASVSRIEKQVLTLFAAFSYLVEAANQRYQGTEEFLEKRWSHRVKAYSDDFTDKEAVAALLRITRGNIRLIERLMLQVEHVLVANQLQIVTKEVVETARQNLIIGPN